MIKNIFIYAIGFIFLTTVLSFNFVDERNIRAYDCDVWQSQGNKTPHPESLSDCVARGLEMTSNPALDYDDFLYTTTIPLENHKKYHFFVLEKLDKKLVSSVDVAYVVYNQDDRTPDHDYLFIRNFRTNQWELLNDMIVLPLEDEKLDSSKDINFQYVNSNSEMMFLSTGNLISTDFFEAKVVVNQGDIIQEKSVVG